jgi:hypothetical protein
METKPKLFLPMMGHHLVQKAIKASPPPGYDFYIYHCLNGSREHRHLFTVFLDLLEHRFSPVPLHFTRTDLWARAYQLIRIPGGKVSALLSYIRANNFEVDDSTRIISFSLKPYRSAPLWVTRPSDDLRDFDSEALLPWSSHLLRMEPRRHTEGRVLHKDTQLEDMLLHSKMTHLSGLMLYRLVLMDPVQNFNRKLSVLYEMDLHQRRALTSEIFESSHDANFLKLRYSLSFCKKRYDDEGHTTWRNGFLNTYQTECLLFWFTAEDRLRAAYPWTRYFLPDPATRWPLFEQRLGIQPGSEKLTPAQKELLRCACMLSINYIDTIRARQESIRSRIPAGSPLRWEIELVFYNLQRAHPENMKYETYKKNGWWSGKRNRDERQRSSSCSPKEPAKQKRGVNIRGRLLTL